MKKHNSINDMDRMLHAEAEKKESRLHEYSKPRLTKLGTLRQLTLGGSTPNADSGDVAGTGIF